MNILNNPGNDDITNNASAGIAGEVPGNGDPKNIEGDDKEIVNEEDQNQVVNAQPVEEFISNYVNKEEPENSVNPVENMEQ